MIHPFILKNEFQFVNKLDLKRDNICQRKIYGVFTKVSFNSRCDFSIHMYLDQVYMKSQGTTDLEVLCLMDHMEFTAIRGKQIFCKRGF